MFDVCTRVYNCMHTCAKLIASRLKSASFRAFDPCVLILISMDRPSEKELED